MRPHLILRSRLFNFIPSGVTEWGYQILANCWRLRLPLCPRPSSRVRPCCPRAHNLVDRGTHRHN